MKLPKSETKLKTPPRVFSKTARLTGELKKPTSRKKLHPHVQAAAEPTPYDPALLDDPHVRATLTSAVKTKVPLPSKAMQTPDISENSEMKEFMQPEQLEFNTPLSELEHVFLYNVVDMRMPAVIAARHAGFKNPTKAANFLMQKPEIILAARQRREEFARLSKMTKERVTEGFLEAIEMARVMSDPATMIKGYVEVAKMHGFYEATKIEMNISAHHEITVQRLQSLSDEELLRLAEGDAPKETYDGIFEHVQCT